ncbi:MAG TPA: RNA polymerase sigma factor [Deltaproteobacteria bacterium]|nr:RNA polymerase sigma factor [Deltaproteobacteria bacterium]
MPKKSNSTEAAMTDMVERTKLGDKNALEAIVRRIQDNIYGLAIRMLLVPADAEDATQEILVKVITNLGTFKGESRFETWVYRIASNHLLTTQKCRAERWKLTFETCEHMIEEGTRDAGKPSFIEAEEKLVVEETKLACVHFLLLCLKRELRLAVILGEIMGVKSADGAEILGLTPAAYRQRLSRGRKRLTDFLVKRCGLVNENNVCHCETLAALHVKKRHIDPNNLYFATHPCRSRQDSHAGDLLQEMNQLTRAAMLIRNNPDYEAPGVFVESMKRLIDSGRFQLLGT